MGNALKGLLDSKKFIVFLGSVVASAMVNLLGVDGEAAQQFTDKLMELATWYLAAQGAADLGRGVGSGKA